MVNLFICISFCPTRVIAARREVKVARPARDLWKEKKEKEEKKKISKDTEFFFCKGGKSTGVLSNESLTGRTNVWHFLIDLITTITPLTNLHNKICKFWVSGRQIVFHFGQYEFCYGCDRVEYQRGRSCGIAPAWQVLARATLALVQVQQIWVTERLEW